jgi:rhodanese-related sulfurtransferase
MPSIPREVDQVRRALLVLPVAVGAIYFLGHSDRSDPKISVKEVLLEEAKALIAAGALIVDVRERAAYEARHIAGALLAPVSTLAAAIPASLVAARTMPLVVYCGDGAALGPKGTQILNKAGFAGAVNLKPGLQGWASAGLPIEQGPGKQA